MNNSPSAIAMLQQDREPMLPDDGFSQRVVRAVPRHPRREVWRRWVSAAALAVGATATAMWAPLPGEASPGTGGAPPMLVSVVFAGLLAVASAGVMWAYVAAIFQGPHDE